MAYVQKTRIEEVAAAIQELRWSEMVDLAQHIAGVEIDGTENPDFWAAVLDDWSKDVMTGFQVRFEAER